MAAPDDGRVAAERVRAHGRRAPRRRASGRTPITALPSLATTSGSMPSRSAAPRTSARTGTGDSSSRMPTFAFCGHLVQRARQAAARRVLHRDDAVAAGRERGPDQAVDRRDVRAQIALERQRVARGHDRHAVVADRAGDDDARRRGSGRSRAPTRSQKRHARRVEDEAVDLAAAHHLGVAGDDGRAGLVAGRRASRRRRARGRRAGSPPR